MYLHKSGLLLEYFHNYFQLINKVHSFNTWSDKSYCLPFCGINIGQFAVKYTKVLNFLIPLNFDVCSCSSVFTFNSTSPAASKFSCNLI